MVAEYKPEVIYHIDSNCIEYVEEDTAIWYDRINEFFDVIRRMSDDRMIGFKIAQPESLMQMQAKVSA